MHHYVQRIRNLGTMLVKERIQLLYDAPKRERLKIGIKDSLQQTGKQHGQQQHKYLYFSLKAKLGMAPGKRKHTAYMAYSGLQSFAKNWPQLVRITC